MKALFGDQRQPTYEHTELEVQRDVAARMRDGVTLYADVYRPAGRGAFPVLLLRTPYGKAQAQSDTYRNPAWYASRGYMVVVQDMRGRWNSEGEFYPFGHEAEDGYDTVQWAASLPRSNGRVGTYGTSYAGIAQLRAAQGRPEGLQTVCPGFTNSQYHDGWAYDGGAFALAVNVSWAISLAMDDARKRGDNRATQVLSAASSNPSNLLEHLPIKDCPPLADTSYGQYLFDWLEHPSYDGYWRRWSVDEDYPSIDVPVLHVGGWYDLFAKGTLRNFEGLKREAGSKRSRGAQKLLVGPWQHLPWTRVVGDVDFGPEASSVVDDWQLAWFDQFLRDEDTGVLDFPVTVFLMGENRWVNYDSWPPEEVQYRDYYLRSGGSANSINGDGRLLGEPPGREPPDRYIYDPLFPTPSVGGHSFPDPTLMGPADQVGVETLNEVLVYTSPPLERELAVVGPVRVTLYASTSAPDTDFTAKLCDVSPAGRSLNLVEGIVRARYRGGLVGPRPVTPGEVQEFAIELGPTAHVFKAGHRLRVQVSSSDFPQWDRNLNTGGPLGAEGAAQARVATQVVLHDAGNPSRVTLPVVHE